MLYLDDLKNLEDKLYFLLKTDNLDEFKVLLSERERLYKDFAKENPMQFSEYVNSDMFKEAAEKINKLYRLKKEEILNEIRQLAGSRKAASEYLSNSGVKQNFLSKIV